MHFRRVPTILISLACLGLQPLPLPARARAFPPALPGAGQSTAVPSVQGPAPAAATTDLDRLYAEGQPFEEFLLAARRRADAWNRNYQEAGLDEAVRARAAGLRGRWRLLVVAVHACSDSVSTLPYIARLDEASDAIDLRIVDARAGRAVTSALRTPDGRAATPTIVLLDEQGRQAGCWIERPAALQVWLAGEGAVLAPDDVYERKMAWYTRDKGGETVRDILAMLEAAAAGRPSCAATR